MFSNTLSFLSSRNVSYQVSHPYKKQQAKLSITGRISQKRCALRTDHKLVLRYTSYPSGLKYFPERSVGGHLSNPPEVTRTTGALIGP